MVKHTPFFAYILLCYTVIQFFLMEGDKNIECVSMHIHNTLRIWLGTQFTQCCVHVEDRK